MKKRTLPKEGSPRKTWTEEHEKLIRSYYEEGVEINPRSLAGKLDITVSTVKKGIDKFCKENRLKCTGLYTEKTCRIEKLAEKEVVGDGLKHRKRVFCECVTYDETTVWLAYDDPSKVHTKLREDYPGIVAILRVLQPEEFEALNKVGVRRPVPSTQNYYSLTRSRFHS